jgi:putrescine transport system permease protein
MEQGRTAAGHAFGLPIPNKPEVFPYGIYAVPEISTVGMSEQDVRQKGVNYEVGIARFRGKTILQATVSAPLVMPDVITGLALLLLFVAMQAVIGWPSGRGVLTIIIAHATFCTAYVTVVVQSRLTDLDLSLEEAAMDLGATPVRVFFDVTLPIIAPALVSGWLLAFTLSLDDLVIASFVSGPGSSTLPMVIYSKVRLGVAPEVNALATIIIGFVAAGVFVATILQLRRPRVAKG